MIFTSKVNLITYKKKQENLYKLDYSVTIIYELNKIISNFKVIVIKLIQ